MGTPRITLPLQHGDPTLYCFLIDESLTIYTSHYLYSFCMEIPFYYLYGFANASQAYYPRQRPILSNTRFKNSMSCDQLSLFTVQTEAIGWACSQFMRRRGEVTWRGYSKATISLDGLKFIVYIDNFRWLRIHVRCKKFKFKFSKFIGLGYYLSLSIFKIFWNSRLFSSIFHLLRFIW